MKIKKITVTEEEQDIQLPMFLKRKDETGFVGIYENKIYETAIYSVVSPSLYVWDTNDERLKNIFSEYITPSTEEEFKAAMQKYITERKKWNEKYMERAAEIIKAINEMQTEKAA